MVGSASAGINVQIDKDQFPEGSISVEDYIPCDKIDIPVTINGNVMTIQLTYLDSLYSVEYIGDIAINLEGTNAISNVEWGTYDYGNGVTQAPINYGNDLGDFTHYINMPNNPQAMKTTGPITITFTNPIVLKDNAKGFSIAVHLKGVEGAQADSVKLGDGECGGNGGIPEFPSIALPVAAILGLAFVFMRRK